MAANQIEEFTEFHIPRKNEEGFVAPLKSADESELKNSFYLQEGNVLTDSGSFFSQLDSMIAAVKVESSALDSMRDRLQEVDNLRSQIAIFNKRLIDADQANLNLKSMLMKAQESATDSKQQKADLEVQNSQLRAELNRVKDNLQKEKAARQAAQIEITSLRDQLQKYEKSNEHYERELKAIHALQESNELLKNDLAHLRRKLREEKAEKAQMTNYIKSLEAQQMSTSALRSDVRGMAMRLLEISNVTTTSTIPPQFIGQQQQQQVRTSYNSMPSVSYQSGSAPLYSDFGDDDDGDDIIGSSYEAAENDLDVKSYAADESASDFSFQGSESLNSGFVRQPPPQQHKQRTVVMGQPHHNHASVVVQQETQQVAAVRNSSGGSGKKKKKKATVVAARQNSSVSLPRLTN